MDLYLGAREYAGKIIDQNKNKIDTLYQCVVNILLKKGVIKKDGEIMTLLAVVIIKCVLDTSEYFIRNSSYIAELSVGGGIETQYWKGGDQVYSVGVKLLAHMVSDWVAVHCAEYLEYISMIQNENNKEEFSDLMGAHLDKIHAITRRLDAVLMDEFLGNMEIYAELLGDKYSFESKICYCNTRSVFSVIESVSNSTLDDGERDQLSKQMVGFFTASTKIFINV